MLEISKTIVGSHMWKMDRPDSDIDYFIIYLEDTRNVFLKRFPKKKAVHNLETNEDFAYHELGFVVEGLKKYNTNLLWGVMSPLKPEFEKNNAIKQLQQIVKRNLTKHIYRSVHGMVKNMVKDVITNGDRESALYKKKLNIAGRTLKFGINILTHNIFLFESVDIKSKEELDVLTRELNDAYNTTTLPEIPANIKEYDDFLVKWRLKALKEEEEQFTKHEMVMMKKRTKQFTKQLNEEFVDENDTIRVFDHEIDFDSFGNVDYIFKGTKSEVIEWIKTKIGTFWFAVRTGGESIPIIPFKNNNVDTKKPNIDKFRKNSKRIKKEVEDYKVANKKSQKLSNETLSKRFD